MVSNIQEGCIFNFNSIIIFKTSHQTFIQEADLYITPFSTSSGTKFICEIDYKPMDSL